MALSLLSRWVFRVPIAIVAAFSLTFAVPGTGITVRTLGIGVEGVWASFSVGATLAFLAAVFWFRLGRWTEGVVDAEEPPAGAPDVADAGGEESALDTDD
jgi:Na+-driven multidrug efflux pump